MLIHIHFRESTEIKLIFNLNYIKDEKRNFITINYLYNNQNYIPDIILVIIAVNIPEFNNDNIPEFKAIFKRFYRIKI